LHGWWSRRNDLCSRSITPAYDGRHLQDAVIWYLHAGKDTNLREMILEKAGKRGTQHGWHHQHRHLAGGILLLYGAIDLTQQILCQAGLDGSAGSESLREHSLQTRLQTHDAHFTVTREPLLADGATQGHARERQQLRWIGARAGCILRSQTRRMLRDCFHNAAHIADGYFLFEQ